MEPFGLGYSQSAAPFWVDMPTVEARVAEPGPYCEYCWRVLLQWAGTKFCGSQALYGALMLLVSRSEPMWPIRVIDVTGFHPASSGFKAATPIGWRARGGWKRIEIIESAIFDRQPERQSPFVLPRKPGAPGRTRERWIPEGEESVLLLRPLRPPLEREQRQRAALGDMGLKPGDVAAMAENIRNEYEEHRKVNE